MRLTSTTKITTTSTSTSSSSTTSTTERPVYRESPPEQQYRPPPTPWTPTIRPDNRNVEHMTPPPSSTSSLQPQTPFPTRPLPPPEEEEQQNSDDRFNELEWEQTENSKFRYSKNQVTTYAPPPTRPSTTLAFYEHAISNLPDSSKMQRMRLEDSSDRHFSNTSIHTSIDELESLDDAAKRRMEFERVRGVHTQERMGYLQEQRRIQALRDLQQQRHIQGQKLLREQQELQQQREWLNNLENQRRVNQQSATTTDVPFTPQPNYWKHQQNQWLGRQRQDIQKNVGVDVIGMAYSISVIGMAYGVNTDHEREF